MNGADLVAVVGPTAAGKSTLGLALAAELGGEILNADAMALYRGMDVGTAKPAPVERAAVPHHLLDLWDVTHPASVVEYQAAARAALAGVRARGRVPVLVGGSGLYVRAVLDDWRFPSTDRRLRERLEAELARHGAAELHRRLRERDPAAAAAILPSNGRRLVRALEVVELTGRPFAASLPGYPVRPGTVVLGLRWPRPQLDARIAARVAGMWDAGLVAEVRGLDRAGLRSGPTASRALGYAQVLRVLDGEWTEEQARADTVRATRRFARRQESWFGRDPRVRWLEGGVPDLLDRALAVVADAGRPEPAT